MDSLIQTQTILFGTISAFNLLFSLAFLVAGWLIVRERRPDAVGLVVVVGLLPLLSSILVPLLSSVMAIAASGTEQIIMITLVTQGVSFFLHLAFLLLLLLTFSKLTRHPSTDRARPRS